jgi:hypothetical protein
MSEATVTKAPTSFWIVSAISLLWNLFGSYDYTMTNLRDPAYLANFPPEMMPWIDTMPGWATSAWAIGVWGSVAGSVLLLLRSRHAITAFVVSLAGAVVSFGYQHSTDIPQVLDTGFNFVMTAVIIGAIVFFWWYARRAKALGILK